MIRSARPHEAAELSELAFRSKAHWGYDEAFMAACRAELLVSAQAIAEQGVFVLEEGGALVGFYTLEPLSARQVELGHLFVEPGEIGRGRGRALLAHACAEARARGFALLVIQGDPNAERFYRAAGARRVGDRPSASIPGRWLPLFELDLAPR